MTMRFHNSFTDQWVDAQPWQEAIKPGDYYCIVGSSAGIQMIKNDGGPDLDTQGMWSLNVDIYGEILALDPSEGTMQRGFHYVRGYSQIEPDGEYGSQCIADFTVQLTKEQFEEARRLGWPDLSDLPSWIAVSGRKGGLRPGDWVAMLSPEFKRMNPNWVQEAAKFDIMYGQIERGYGPGVWGIILDKRPKPPLEQIVEIWAGEPTPIYRYLARVRPPHDDCRPTAGAIRYRAYYPLRALPLPDMEGFVYAGWVDYIEPLAYAQCAKYDLFPENLVDRWIYRIWNWCEQSNDQTRQLLDNYYCMLSGEGFTGPPDFMVTAVMALQGLGYKLEDVLAHLDRPLRGEQNELSKTGSK